MPQKRSIKPGPPDATSPPSSLPAPPPGPFLPPAVEYVYDRLPTAAFSASDVAALCAEAGRALDVASPPSAADVVDLLTAHELVGWSEVGFVKQEPPRLPRGYR